MTAPTSQTPFLHIVHQHLSEVAGLLSYRRLAEGQHADKACAWPGAESVQQRRVQLP